MKKIRMRGGFSMIDNKADNLKGVLGRKNKKMTPQRRKILDIFAEHPHEHLSAEEIYDALRLQQETSIGLATVYRTLDLLTELGVLSSIELHGVNRYELNKSTPDSPHQHHHLICLRCGKVMEFHSPLTAPLEKEIRKQTGFHVHDHQLKFFGYCEDCQRELAEEKAKAETEKEE